MANIIFVIVQCDQCNAKFKLDDSKIKGKGVKVRCSKCKAVFSVKPPSSEEATESAVPPTPEPTPSAPKGPSIDFDDGLGDFPIQEDDIPDSIPDEPGDGLGGFEFKDEPEPPLPDDDKLDFGIDFETEAPPPPDEAPPPMPPEPPAPEPSAPEPPPDDMMEEEGEGNEEDFGDFDFGDEEGGRGDDIDMGADDVSAAADTGDDAGFSDSLDDSSFDDGASGESPDDSFDGIGDDGPDFGMDDDGNLDLGGGGDVGSGGDDAGSSDFGGGDDDSGGFDTDGFDDLGGTSDLPDDDGPPLTDELDDGFSLDTTALGGGDDDSGDDLPLDRGTGGMDASDFDEQLVQGAGSGGAPKDNYEANLEFGGAAEQHEESPIPPSERGLPQEEPPVEEPGEAPKIIPPHARLPRKAKKGGGAKIFIILVVLIAAIGGGGFVLEKQGKIDSKAFKEFQKKPSVDNLKKIFRLSSGKPARKDYFEVKVTGSKEMKNTKSGDIYVMTGTALNHYETLRRNVLLEGRLVDQNGTSITATAYIGTTNMEDMVANLTRDMIEQVLSSPTAILSDAGVTDDFDRNVSNPGDKSSFIIVFFDLPEGAVVKPARIPVEVKSSKGLDSE